MNRNDLNRIINSVTGVLRHKVNLMISRVVLDAVDDASSTQSVQLRSLPGEVLDDVEHMQPGGLAHVAGKGAEGLIFCIGGNRDQAVAGLLAERAKRPTGLAQGETAIYITGPNAKKILHGLQDGTILVDELATEFAARADKVDNELGKIKSELEGHEHTYVAALHPGSPDSTTGNTASYSKVSTAAENVKIK